jgi:hypothetical protein
MNERIKELWEDSDDIEVCYPEQGSPVSVSAKTLETFAELIVRECAGKVDFILREKSNGGGTMGDEIREHFGVEE